MSNLRHRLRSDLSNLTETKRLLKKIKDLVALSPRHLVIAKGSFRANAADLADVALDETLSHNNIQFQRAPLNAGKEVTDITAIADNGALEASSITAVADVAGSLNSKYFTFSDALDAHKYYVWLNVNSAGVDPAVAGRTGIEVDVATGASANTIATAIRAAITSAAGSYVTVGGSNAIVLITNKKLGNSTDAADGAAATGFTIAVTTQGHASSLQNTYLTLHSANDTHKHYVWLNVNSEGVDPAPGGYTGGIEVDIAAGASATTIATAAAAAIDAQADYVCAVPSSATFRVVNAAAGPSTDVADGAAPTGFTISKVTEEECYDLSDIEIIKRLRTKKYLIRINANANPTKL